MNMVEHPFAALKRTSETVLELSWEKRHPRTGKTLQASWRVEGSGELGLPGPAEERLYLVLMELSREQNWPRRVVFSRSELLSRLGITKAKSNYSALHDSFLRLKSVTIDAKRSFWNKSASDFAASLQFAILDEVELIDEPAGRRSKQLPLALSSFTWSRVLQESFVAGNVRSLHIEFALSLDLPISARLFRYLDKHRTGDGENLRHKYEIELHRLCEIHLGMKTARYASKLKERLLPALHELKARNFLADWSFEPMKSAPGHEKAVFYFCNETVFCAPPPLPSDLSSVAPVSSLAPSLETPLALPLALSLADTRTNVGTTVFGLLAPFEFGDDDAARLDAACDRVHDALPEGERAGIRERALSMMPDFWQRSQSEPGAKRTLLKNRRADVWSRHKAEVLAELEAGVAHE